MDESFAANLCYNEEILPSSISQVATTKFILSIATPAEQNLNQLEEQPQSSKRQRQGINLDSLPTDPKERILIRDYHPNEQLPILVEVRTTNLLRTLFPFDSIIDVIDTIVVDAWTLEKRSKAKGYLSTCQTFEVAFMLHLMRDVLGITNELNTSLQKKEQDIANVILLVEVAKKRSRRKVANYTILHHYRVDIFFKIIDSQVEELNARFNEVTSNLLVRVTCLNPVDSFSSFDINKILMMTELYPDDFDENIMVTLKNQLETYIVDVRDFDKRFSNLQGLVDLSEILVKTKKHLNYPFVFRLVKFALLLPVPTAIVERTFSALKLIKSELQNRMNYEFMSGCLYLM
uniref:Uncharacterized protein LOC104218645 n=2 Tax=Nicotiana sylvestris TaxID=4096 RepID=A0A1U7VHD5_NICSY|nr:PREDICTED: uncharacterized protein LOC104218645 [Nicotiana sylvestris]